MAFKEASSFDLRCPVCKSSGFEHKETNIRGKERLFIYCKSCKSVISVIDA